MSADIPHTLYLKSGDGKSSCSSAPDTPESRRKNDEMMRRNDELMRRLEQKAKADTQQVSITQILNENII